MRALIVLALAQAVFCASVVERAKQCGGTICTADYSPVCGTDGHTYSNTCHLGIATCNDPSVTLAHKGQCGLHVIPQHCQIMCIDLWDPVCGSDGKTYGNDCNLKAAACADSSITMAHKGSCGGGAIIV